MTQDDPVWQALLTGDKEACSQIYKFYAKQMYLFGMLHKPTLVQLEIELID